MINPITKSKTDKGNYSVWRGGTLLAVFRFDYMADVFIKAMEEG